ncbi:MAG: hypothetical protein QOD42_3587 [Sphingomonadales bacterium]|jgi:hypothetical protein|nr:hypothetical protein [Sphingomonadales bacterium]
MSEANPFNPRLVYGLIAAGLIAFGALVLMLAYGPPLRDGEGHVDRAQMLSPSAVGYKALTELVGQFRDARIISSATDLDDEGLFVMAVGESTLPEDVEWVRARRSGRATLIILPKWVTGRHSLQRDWVTLIGPGAGQSVARALGFELRSAARPLPGEPARGTDILEGLTMPIPAFPQVIEGPDVIPLVSLPDGGGALVARIGDQPLYVVADPDLLNNHRLGDPRVARAALGLIDGLNATGTSAVNFGTFSDRPEAAPARPPSLIRLAVEPPFLAMTLALIAAALLAGLHGAVRFGQPRREERAIALGKAALVENSAGLIKLAGREAALGAAYADVVRHDAARAVGAPPALSGEALDAYLDRLSKGDGPKFTQLANDVVWARDRHELVAAARALFSWKKDIIR